MFRCKIVPLCLFAAVFSAVLSCCSFFTDYTYLTVAFPSGGAPWEKSGGISSCLLVYPDPFDSGNRLVRREVEPGTEEAVITLRKGTAVPVALYPNGTLKPAGGIYPLDLSGTSVLLLSEKEGFLAGILLDLHAESSRTEAVNIPRLRQVITEKSGGDPWTLDGEVLKRALVLGSLSVYKVKKKEVLEVSVPRVPGVWISDDPFKGKAVSGSDGSLQLNLSYGTHAFLNRETHDELYVSVSEGRYSYIVKKK